MAAFLYPHGFGTLKRVPSLCKLLKNVEARVGIEPTHKGFADLLSPFVAICTQSVPLAISMGCRALRPTRTSPSKPAPATVAGLGEP